MKSINLLILVLFLGTIETNAQMHEPPRFDPKEMASRTVNELGEEIKISTAVQDSLKSTFIRFFEEMDKGRKSGERPDIMKIEGTCDAKVKKFLTDEQYKVYQSFIEEKRKNHRGGPINDDNMRHDPPEKK